MKLKKIFTLGLTAIGFLSLASCDQETAVTEIIDENVGGNSSFTDEGEGQNQDNGNNNQTDNGGSQVSEGDNTIPDSIKTGELSISSYAGDQESLFAEFAPVVDATKYNVYVKGENLTDYTKIDDELVRLYKGSNNTYYYRVDAVGLKAGIYSIKINPVINGTENTAKGGEVTNIKVVAYDRTGFAFSTDSPLNGTAPGAYNNDGTLKSGAQVIYLTEENKKTVKATVKGVEYTGIAEITGAIKTKNTNVPYVIRVIGKLDYRGTVCSELSKWYAMGCKEASNITVEGIGNDATMYYGGVGFNKCNSIEVRNLGFMEWGSDNKDADAIQFQGTVNVWVHDNDIFYGHKQSGDQAKGDGSTDLKDDTKYMTVSYNHYWDSGKMSLCGMKSETGDNYISYHHNWFDHSDSRHPRIRTMSVHVYNNYFDGNSKYGVGVTYGASAFVESNYFRNCKNPMLSSLTGTDALGEGTLSDEPAGAIKAYNNYIIGAKSLIYANADMGTQGATTNRNASSYDAILVSTRDEVVSDTFNAGNKTYNNFDTKVDLGVTLSQIQSPEDAVVTTKNYAGRVQGGDFKYEFDNSTADSSYAIDENLANLIVSYKSNLVSSQTGEGTDQTEEGQGQTGGGTNQQEEQVVTPTTGTSTISFNNSKVETTGTVNFEANISSYKTLSEELSYNGTKYSVAAKFDSNPSITFTITEAKTITIYTASKAVGAKLNVGDKKIVTTTSSIEAYSLNLEANTYTINKNSGELYILLIVIS